MGNTDKIRGGRPLRVALGHKAFRRPVFRAEPLPLFGDGGCPPYARPPRRHAAAVDAAVSTAATSAAAVRVARPLPMSTSAGTVPVRPQSACAVAGSPSAPLAPAATRPGRPPTRPRQVLVDMRIGHAAGYACAPLFLAARVWSARIAGHGGERSAGPTPAGRCRAHT